MPDPLITDAEPPALPLRLDVRRGMGKEGETVKTVRVATFYNSAHRNSLGAVCGRITKNLPSDPEAEAPAWAQSLLAWSERYGNLHHALDDANNPPEPIGIQMFRLIDPVKKQVWETSRADIEMHGRQEDTPNGKRFFLQMRYLWALPFYEEPPETDNSAIIQDIDFAENAKGLIPIPPVRDREEMLNYFFPYSEAGDTQEAMQL